MTNTERQAKCAAAKRARGLVPVLVWVPRPAVAEFKRAAELIAEQSSLRIGRMVDENTGRIRGLGR